MADESTGIRDSVLHSDPTVLAKLLVASELFSEAQYHADLATVMSQVLQTRIDSDDVLLLEPSLGAVLCNQIRGTNLRDRTFAEALFDPKPSTVVLDAIKSFARQCSLSKETCVPRDVTFVLYYIAIAAALVRCGESISRLDPRDLSTGLKWAVQREWLDVPTRQILGAAHNKLARLMDEA